jgi:hypothetical protein
MKKHHTGELTYEKRKTAIKDFSKSYDGSGYDLQLKTNGKDQVSDLFLRIHGQGSRYRNAECI